MPENESLSLSSKGARQWITMKNLLDSGEPMDKVLSELEKAFHNCLRHYWEHLKTRGIDPNLLFAEAIKRSKQFETYQQMGGHDDFTLLLKDIVEANQSFCLETILKQWLLSLFDYIRDLIELDRREQCLINDVTNRITHLISRMSSQFAKDLSRVPRRRRGETVSSSDQSALLDKKLRFDLL